MPLNLASPGVLIREVDLTVGRIDPVSPSVGALAAPFAQGPVGEPTLIENENDLLNTFGKPYNVDNHYCLLYTSPSPRDKRQSRMPSSA